MQYNSSLIICLKVKVVGSSQVFLNHQMWLEMLPEMRWNLEMFHNDRRGRWDMDRQDTDRQDTDR